MQHSAQTGSSRRQERVPLEVEIDLRGTGLASSLARKTARFDQPGPLGELASDEQAGDEQLARDERSGLAADGLNVSIGGIAMRAPFVPTLGAVLECSFQCPPTGELVCAQGEVMWSERTGPDEGLFGLRFVELDTKSATALRRYVAPNGPAHEGTSDALHDAKPERTRMIALSIDGLGAPVEAELKLSDDSRVVLEQQLSFLQLGRGVELAMPDAGGKSRKQRGRIASVELRHTHFDVPTLVFGVLLDEAPERVAPAVAAEVAPLFSAPVWSEPPVTARASARMRDSASLARPSARFDFAPADRSASSDQVSDEEGLEWPTHEATTRVSRAPEPPSAAPSAASAFMLAGDEHDEPAARTQRIVLDARPRAGEPIVVDLPLDESRTQPDARLPGSAADSAPSLVVEDAELDEAAYMDAHAAAFDKFAGELVPPGSELDEEHEPEHDTEVAGPPESPAPREGELVLQLRSLPAHLRALFGSSAAHLQGLRRRVEPALREHAEYFDLPDAKTRFLLQLARLRMLFLQSLSKLRRSPRRTGPRAPRALRVQRSTLLGMGPADGERHEPSKTARTVAIAFAAVGVGLCVYALAPRSSADRIKLPQRAEGLAEASRADTRAAAKVELDLSDDAIEPPAEPKRLTRKAARRAAQLAALQAAENGTTEPTASVTSAPFGEASIANGRVFALRMNGPVQVVEGEARDNGITVRIPGRQAIDRASPIATSHSAVARAMILNRGGYAELTIDFVPGMSPRYQVRGKDNTLEVTLERL